MIKISKDHAALFVKKLDAGSNYGYIVQDALYSESRPDFDDALDYYEYEENYLISEGYSFFKDLQSILVEIDCTIENGQVYFAKNYASFIFDITDFKVCKESIFIHYIRTDLDKAAEDGSLEQEYHSLTIKKFNKKGSEAIKPLKFKWDNISYYEDIESLLGDLGVQV